MTVSRSGGTCGPSVRPEDCFMAAHIFGEAILHEGGNERAFASAACECVQRKQEGSSATYARQEEESESPSS